MGSPEYIGQTARIKRLAQRECPAFTVVLDESEMNIIRFQLEDTTQQKRSGHSLAARPEAIKGKDDDRLKKLLHLMGEQIKRQG